MKQMAFCRQCQSRFSDNVKTWNERHEPQPVISQFLISSTRHYCQRSPVGNVSLTIEIVYHLHGCDNEIRYKQFFIVLEKQFFNLNTKEGACKLAYFKGIFQYGRFSRKMRARLKYKSRTSISYSLSIPKQVPQLLPGNITRHLPGNFYLVVLPEYLI